MNINKIKIAMKIAYGAGDAVHMIGRHGIGKSEIVNQFGRDNGFHVEILQLPILETSDLVGMPDITETQFGKVTTWAAPEWVHRVHEANAAGKPAVIFLGELGRASVEIRQAALQLVLESKVNEHKLEDVLFVVADNPADEYDTAEFDMALEDRFQTYDVEPDINDWLDYARNNGVIDVVSSYLAEMPEKLHFTPETDGEKGSSPRAWKKLSDGVKEALKEGEEEFIYSLITSKVGKTVGANFFHYYNNYIKVVKVEDITKMVKEITKGNDLVKEKDQREAAEKLGEFTRDIELISAQELGNKLMSAYRKDKASIQDLTLYVASLNKEVQASIMKDWKTSKDVEVKKVFRKDIQAYTEKKWLLKELVANVEQS